MRDRPIRDNYPNGKFGEIDYQERLEMYCTYLENKLTALNKVASSQPIIIAEQSEATSPCTQCTSKLPKHKNNRSQDVCSVCGTIQGDG